MDFPSSNVSSGMFYFLHGKRIYIVSHCLHSKNLKSLENCMVIIASILFLYGKLLFKRSKRILKQEVLRVFVSYSDAFKVMKGLIAILIMYSIFFAKLLVLNMIHDN